MCDPPITPYIYMYGRKRKKGLLTSYRLDPTPHHTSLK